MIEVCLKTAALRFTPPSTEGWSWCDSVKQFAQEYSVSISYKNTETATQDASRQAGGQTKASGKAEVKLPFLDKAEVSASQEAEYSAKRSQGKSEALEQAFAIRKDHVEQLRDHASFEMRLTSPGGQDLVRMNGDLTRLSILSVPEPSSLDPASVSVSLNLRLSGAGAALEHSLEIRTAAGSWAALKSSRNKQVIAELILSKFLQPLHKPTSLWPPKGSKGG